MWPATIPMRLRQGTIVDTSMTLAPGARLGPYEILAIIGAGGMGEVYQARDPRLDRTVAVKISQEQFTERFGREAHAVAALNHPNVCTLHDVGPNYLVMEYIEGETLASRLAKGPLQVREALKYAVQMAGALDAAHRLNIIHRDLKPQNIMLTRTGAKLLDFGLAKVRPASGEDDRTLTKSLTGEGTIVGTYHYMAPEVLSGAEADARADIFAFGAVLYEMLTGLRAFDGKSRATIIGAILHTEPPPLSSKQPLASPALEHLVNKCLAKDPEERWQSARDLAGELEWIASAGSQTGVPAVVAEKMISWHRLPWMIAAVLGLALAASTTVAVRHWLEEPSPSRPIRLRIEPPPGNRAIGSFVVSPDGDKMAFSSGGPAASRIYLRSFNSLTAQPLSGTEGGFPLAFSPDGRSLAVSAGSRLRRVDLSSGTEETICELRNVNDARSGSWSRNNALLFVTVGGPIMEVSAGGGVARPATAIDRSREEGNHASPSFLPDGRHFLYSAFSVSWGRRAVLVGRLGDPQWRKIILEGTGPAQFAAPGYVFYTRENSLVARPFDTSRLEFAGDPTPIADGLASIPQAPNLSPFFGVSQGGVVHWRPGRTPPSQIYWHERSGTRKEPVGEPGDVTNPVLSPDGKRLLITRRDPGSGTRDIWIHDLARGALSRLTFDPAEDFNPAWSPDGAWVAFSSNRKGHKDLYRKRADGIGAEEELLASNIDKNLEDWSPDGRSLLFNTFEIAGRGDLFLLPLAGNRQPRDFLKSPVNEQQATVSPNGRWIAYTSAETGAMQVYVQPSPLGGVPAGKWQISAGQGAEPRWRRDGRELFYRTGDAVMAVLVKTDDQTFESGAPTKLFDAPRGRSLRNTYDVSPDGQRFILEVPETSTTSEPPIVLINWTALLKRDPAK